MATITVTPGVPTGSTQFPLGTDNTIFLTDASSNDTVVIGGGVQNIVGGFNQGGDTIRLVGNASAYQVRTPGGSIIITGPNGTVVTIPAPSPTLSAAQQPTIAFADATFKFASSVAGGTPTFTLTSTAAGSTPFTVSSTATTVPTGGVVNPPASATVAVAVANGTEGAANITYTFTLSAAQSSAVSLNVATTGGTATVGSDYTPVSTQVTFAPGQTTQFLTVNVIDDTLFETTTPETVILSITAPAGITAPATVTATITDNESAPPPSAPLSFQLTTGSDTFTGGDGNDRISGVQDTTQPGKLLSQNDRVNGTGNDAVTIVNGVTTNGDLLELFNTFGGGAVANTLDDVDFTNVLGIERLESNYNQITLGTEAAEAGISFLSTISSDTRNTSGAGPVAAPGNPNNAALNGASLGLGVALTLQAGFAKSLVGTLSSLSFDTVSLNLASAGGSAIDTGSTGSRTDVNGVVTQYNAIDRVAFTGTIVNPIRVTFVSGEVGNNTSTSSLDGQLAVRVQSEDANDTPVGGIVRFDDEGLRLTGAQFDVRGANPNNAPDTPRGTFGEVLLGTNAADGTAANPLQATTGTSIYINAGQGNDFLLGTGGADFLVGGAGNDRLDGGAGADLGLLGGAGDDIIIGGAGIDVLLDGGEDSDVYVYVNAGINPEFVASEALADTGLVGTDYIALTSDVAINDALFGGRPAGANIEGLTTNVTPNNDGAGQFEVTVGANAQGLGITQFAVNNDDFNASTYTVGISVRGTASITAGTAADQVFLQSSDATLPSGVQGLGFGTNSTANFAYTGAVNLGAGADTLTAGYALGNLSVATLNGGTGAVGEIDTLVLGAVAGGALGAGANRTAAGVGALGALTPFAVGNATFTNFEKITINNAGANAAASYILNIGDANVDPTNGALVIDGGALRGTVTGAGVNGLVGDADDLNTSEILQVNANLTAGNRAVSVIGGGGADVLNGGNFNDRLEGRGGNDTLNGGLGDDVIRGGDNDDQITGGAGNDDLDGEAGNDNYIFADTELTATDKVADTAGGTDTITVTNTAAIQDAVFALKSGVEVLTTNVTGGDQNGATDVFVGALARAAGIVTVNAGNDDVSAVGYDADGLTINIGSNTGVIAANAGNVIGSARNDIVVINSATNYTAGTGSIALGDGNDRLDAGVSLSDQALDAGLSAILDGGAGTGDELRIGGLNTGYGAGATQMITHNFTGANFRGWEKITVLAPEVGAGAVAGVALDFTINLSSTSGLPTSGPLVIDAATLGAVNSPAGVFAAGTNTQQLIVNASPTPATAYTGALSVTGGSADDTITTGSGADTLIGGAGNDTLRGNAGFDDYQGGTGDDTIILSVLEFNSDADKIDGGENANDADVLQIEGTQNLAAGGGTLQDIADVGFSTRIVKDSIEQITLVGIQGGNTAFNYQAGFYSQNAGVNVINVGARASGSTVSIANYTVGGPGNFPAFLVTLNDNLTGVNNDTTFIGSASADIFNLGTTNSGTAGGGVDKVFAGQGADTINFGNTLTAADVVYGGASGADIDTLNISGGTGGVFTLQAANTGNQALASGIFGVEKIVLATAANTAAGSVYNFTVDNTTFEGTSLEIDGSGLRAAGVVAGVGVTTAETLTVNVNGNVTANTLTVRGGGANDLLNGGGGNDSLFGNGGDDTLNGNAGNDTLTGGDGIDTLNGGVGLDKIIGNAGGDIINGGDGIDTIYLGVSDTNNASDGARDQVTVGVAGNDVAAARASSDGIETIFGFERDSTAGAGFTATADVINFGNGIISDAASASLNSGMVRTTSVLGTAVEAQTTLLAAIQLVEQEFNNNVALDNVSRVVAFEWKGSTYIGEVSDVNAAAGSVVASFVDIVKLDSVTGTQSLIDTGGNFLGLAI